MTPYLHRRSTIWYFRFKLPGRLRALTDRAEIRLSVATEKLSIARERAVAVLPQVYFLKRINRQMDTLEPQHVRIALDTAFTSIVNTLERSKEPWMRRTYVAN
jgi:hypothetical protein